MPREITVSGGSTGTRAGVDDMETLAGELLGIAEELAAILLRTGGGEADLALEASMTAAPATGMRLKGACDAFALTAAGASARIAVTGTALGAAAAAYTAADAAVAALFEQVLRGMGNVLGHAVRTALPLLLPIAAAGAVAVGTAVVVIERTGLDDALERALGIDLSEVTGDVLDALGRGLFAGSDAAGVVIETVLPGFIAGFAGVPPGMQAVFDDHGPWPHDSQSATGLVIAAGRAGGLFARTGVEVSGRERLVPEGTSVQAPRNIVELFDRQLTAHRGRDNGQVQIERIVAEDGTVRWIVYIPATTDWSPVPGGNSSDLTTNVEAAAGHDTVMREVVRQAVADAGIGPDEEVMLVGYSQGGITAASLAADPDFLADVRVSALFTVASPVSDFDIPPEVSTLSIEHEQDLVPDLDGNQNPDRAHWTTITVDLDLEKLADDPMFEGRSDDEIADILSSPGFPHGGVAYEATIAALHAGGSAGLLAWSARNAGFFGGEVTRTRDYTGKRR